MIIWSRWGILVLLCVGLGTATGALLAAVVLPGVRDGSAYGLFMGLGVVLGGLYTYLLNRFVLEPHLDRPRQQFFVEPLPQPVTHPNGFRQTHRQVPVVHPETGQPLWVRPRSSLFFIPVRIWPVILVSIGAVVLLGCLVGVLSTT